MYYSLFKPWDEIYFVTARKQDARPDNKKGCGIFSEILHQKSYSE
jgi:hypothetical protein